MKMQIFVLRKIIFSLFFISEFTVFSQNEGIELRVNNEFFLADSIYYKADSTCILNGLIKKCFLSTNIQKVERLDRPKIISIAKQNMYSNRAIATECAMPINKSNLYLRNIFLDDIALVYAFFDGIQLEVGNGIFDRNYFDSGAFIGLKVAIPILKERITVGGKYAIQQATELAPGNDVYSDTKVKIYNAMITFGNSENNLTVGYKYENYDFEDDTQSLYLSAAARISNGSFLVAEHQNFGKDLGFTALGLRKNKPKFSFSYGARYHPETYYEANKIRPYVGLIIPLHSKNNVK